MVKVKERRPYVSSGRRRRGREMEDRGGSSGGEDLCRSSGEGERRKTDKDLPGAKT